MDIGPLIPSKDVSLQRVGQEAILHDRRNGRAHVVNESAAQIWELCDGHSTFDQIASTFAASYDVPVAVVQADVRSILAKFRELRILE
jgi:PqqD family protein of HPr-rel-A system